MIKSHSISGKAAAPSIVKNTAILYMRTLLVLFLSLFSTRIIISMLGVEDFGIANVVSSVVALSYFFHNALTVMSQRYLAYEVGIGNSERIKHTLHNITLLHFMIAGCALLILETLGLWFFLSKLNIPVSRQGAALYMYHASVAVASAAVRAVPISTPQVRAMQKSCVSARPS